MYKCTTPAYTHRDSEKSQVICSSVTTLGLLKKERKMNEVRWRRYPDRTLISNVIPMKLKAAVNMDAPVQHV